MIGALSYTDLPTLLASNEVTEGEKAYLEYRLGFCGEYMRYLFDTINRADYEHKSKLALGYPEEVAAYISWTEGSLKSRCAAILAHSALEVKISG